MELKKWSLAYINDMVVHANNKNVSKHLRNVFPFPYTDKDAKDFISFCQSCDEGSLLNLAILVNEQVVGGINMTIGSDIEEKSAEIGYWLGEAYWGQGIMSDTIRQLIDIAFTQYDLVRLYAKVLSHNQASCKVLKKCGFTYEGTLRKSVYKEGRYYDSDLYALIKE